MHSTVTAENIPIEPQLWRSEEQEGSDCVNMPSKHSKSQQVESLITQLFVWFFLLKATESIAAKKAKMKGQHVNKKSRRIAYLTYDSCIVAAQYSFKWSP